MTQSMDANTKNRDDGVDQNLLEVRTQIIDSEKRYVESMQIAWQTFGREVFHNWQRWNEQGELASLLVEMRYIRALTFDLLQEIETDANHVVDAFVHWTSFLRLYQRYSSCHQEGMAVLLAQKLRGETNANKLQSIMIGTNTERRIETSLGSLLALPIQRIPR